MGLISDTWDALKSGAKYITGMTARDNYKRAERIVRNAEDEFQAAMDAMDEARKQASAEFEGLGRLRLKLEDGQMRRFVDAIKSVTSVEYKPLELQQFAGNLTLPSVQAIEVSAYAASDLLKDGIQAVSAGTLAGVGALGVATTFGVASTGTAISTLSGVAATNATLAWFGGGSLAAGGLGVAGGTAVLGGIIAAPVVLILASRATAKSEVALTQAFKQRAEYEVATKEVETLIAKLACVIARTQEIFECTVALSDRFEALLQATQNLVAQKAGVKEALTRESDIARQKYARRFFLLRWFDKLFGRAPTFSFPDPLDFDNFNEQERTSYMLTLNMGFALYALLKVQVIDDAGSLTLESKQLVHAGQVLLGAPA